MQRPRTTEANSILFLKLIDGDAELRLWTPRGKAVQAAKQALIPVQSKVATVQAKAKLNEVKPIQATFKEHYPLLSLYSHAAIEENEKTK